jgi:hypothetical protein
MAYAALAVACFALGFAIASFWWLHARTGSLEAAAPRSYAFADRVRLRLPFAFFVCQPGVIQDDGSDGRKALDLAVRR